MARHQKFHTFEAEINGRIDEKQQLEQKAYDIGVVIQEMETQPPKKRMEYVEWEQKLKALRIEQDTYKGCYTQYLLDVVPHIQRYQECLGSLHQMQPHTPHHYNMGSIYRDYQKSQHIDEFVSFEGRSNLGSVCQGCNSDQMIRDTRSSCNVCTECGQCVDMLEIGPVNSTFGQVGAVQTKYAYKRINHFNEWLNTFQAKENTVIEEEVLTQVANEFKKNRFVQSEDFTTKRVREYLKKLKLNKYYEHSTQIAQAISGILAKKISPEQERRLRTMFQIIQVPFEEVCPADRKNFPSYSYILHKFCELLEYDDIIHMFPLLKSREKLFQLDKIWKAMCQKLQWQFISSI